MKTAVLGVAIFLLSLAAATALGVWLRPAATMPIGEEPVAAEIDLRVTDSLPPPEVAAVATAMSEPAPVVEMPVVETPPPAPPPPAPAGQDSPASSARQVARIIAQMKPQEAGELLGFLSDDDAERILCHLGARQAAGVLGSLPAERAATLARRSLRRGAESCDS